MSKRIRINYEARNKRDAKEFIRWTKHNIHDVFEECDVELSCKQFAELGQSQTHIPDEILETQLNAAASDELDALAKLASAAEEYYQSDDYLAVHKARRKSQKERKERFVKVVAAVATGSWLLAIELIKQTISGD